MSFVTRPTQEVRDIVRHRAPRSGEMRLRATAPLLEADDEYELSYAFLDSTRSRARVAIQPEGLSERDFGSHISDAGNECGITL